MDGAPAATGVAGKRGYVKWAYTIGQSLLHAFKQRSASTHAFVVPSIVIIGIGHIMPSMVLA